MSRRLAVLILPVLCAACGSSRPPQVSSLEQYQRLAAGLRAATLSSQRLASATGRLARWMARGDVRQTRAAASRMRGDAQVLSRTAGRLVAAVGPIEAREHNHARRTYFQLVLGALGNQRSEGASVESLAQVVWRDPYAYDPRDFWRVRRLDRRSTWFAWRAVTLASAAQRWRAENWRRFLYAPVAPLVASGPRCVPVDAGRAHLHDVVCEDRSSLA